MAYDALPALTLTEEMKICRSTIGRSKFTLWSAASHIVGMVVNPVVRIVTPVDENISNTCVGAR